MITLRPVAITDLSVKYARDMGNGKVRHYKVPYSVTLISKYADDVKVEKEIADFIFRTEGEEHVVFESPVFESPEHKQTNNFLNINYHNEILASDSSLKKALEKRKLTRLIYEFDNYTGFWDRFSHEIGHKYNSLVFKLNPFLNKFGIYLSHITFKNRRRFYPVRFFTLAYTQDKYEEAKNAFLQDLQILNNHNLILGTLAMPFTLTLADTVGVGNPKSAFGCFVALDEEKLAKLAGTSWPNTDGYSLLTHNIGVKCETQEGVCYEYPGNTQYEIEEVSVDDMIYERGFAAHLQAQLEAQDRVNDIARTHKDLLNTVEKVSNSYTEVSQNENGSYSSKVHVNVTMVPKKS